MSKPNVSSPKSWAIFTKLFVVVIGLFLLVSIATLTIKNISINTLKTTASQKYDFYVKFNTDFVLSKNYFQNFIKTDKQLTKVRIDTLPNHSTLKLNDIQVFEGQEIDINSLNNLIFHPYVDQYDTYTWSGFDGVSYLSPIEMKVGVGAPIPCEGENQDSGSNTTAITSASLCINGGPITLYPGDNNPNNDICSNADITATTNNPGSPVVQEGVTCNTSENSISLGSVSTAPIRQNPSTVIDDILFDDLSGEAVANYTITAEISNFVDNNNSNVITLGSNPDGATATLDTGIISSIVVTNGGTGYTTAPTIAFTGGGGSGATATATVSSGSITRIDVRSYGTGYTTPPTVVIVPTNGGTGATATANIVAVGDNLNPLTSNPEATLFATLDPSVGTISKLKPNVAANPANFTTGPRALVTATAVQHTLFSTSTPVPTGRYTLDDTLFALRTPAYVPSGDYRATITQTIIADVPTPSNNAPVVSDTTKIVFEQMNNAGFTGSFTSAYSDADNDPLASVTIVSLPAVGTLKLNGVDINAGDTIIAADLINITYIAPAPGTTTFTWKASDGTADSNIATMTLDIQAQNN